MTRKQPPHLAITLPSRSRPFLALSPPCFSRPFFHLGFLTWIFDSMSNEAAESEDSESADEGSKVNVKNYVEVFADGEW